MEIHKDQTFTIRGKRSKRSRLSTVDSSSSSTTGSSAAQEEEEEEEGVIFEMNQFTISQDFPPSEEEQDMANCLILLAQGQTRDDNHHNSINFRCRTCDRGFPSFQALGGHRASHKKPKTDIYVPPVGDHNQLLMIENDRTALSLTLQIPHSLVVKSKVHECSVCGAEFSSGQALGGHMRRHRPIVPLQTAVAVAVGVGVRQTDSDTRRKLQYLDLNLPAPEDDCRDLSKFPFGSKSNGGGGKVIVFSSASPMVDCHY